MTKVPHTHDIEGTNNQIKATVKISAAAGWALLAARITSKKVLATCKTLKEPVACNAMSMRP